MTSEVPELVKDLENLVILNKTQSQVQTTKHLYCLIWAKEYRDEFSVIQGITLKFQFPSRKQFQHKKAQILLKYVEEIGGKNAILDFTWYNTDSDEE